MLEPEATLGRSIPAETPHAVSVSLPTWQSNVGYEEGQHWVVSKMTTGYPRFVINKKIIELSEAIVARFATPDGYAMLFPSSASAQRCVDFMKRNTSSEIHQSIAILRFQRSLNSKSITTSPAIHLSAVIFPKSSFKVAKSFWQHSGEGISSRRAEYYKILLDHGILVPKQGSRPIEPSSKGPKRYRKVEDFETAQQANGQTYGSSFESANGESTDQARYVEERFGRNLNLELAEDAKRAVKRRITGSLTRNEALPQSLSVPLDPLRMRDPNLSEDDVYLYSCGMNSIFNSHRMVLSTLGEKKSICYGFPYIDTLKVLEKFGPGCLFYGNGTSEDLDDLERRLTSGEKYASLFCEFPSNPLLKSPDLKRIRHLADKFEFVIVVDETIGNFLNVNVLPYVDVLVSSLTKIFSGDSNVMGGCAILNPQGPYYKLLKQVWTAEFEDNCWPEDIIFLERNSRDFASRIVRINVNAEAICKRLQSHPQIKNIYYPFTSPSKDCYDAHRTSDGGYGGLLSATFYSTEEAAAFYDALETEKGPSLGTNFTLVSPFVLLAHYTELEWAAQFGVEKNLLRFSVGLEDTRELVKKLDVALQALEAAKST